MTLLDQWHQAVFGRDLTALEALLADDILFYSPFFWKPKQGKAEAMLILSNVIEIFQEFQYHREVVMGQDWALEFSAKVGDLSLKGIDLIHINEQGKFQTFEVLIRPANALQALGMAMAQRLGAS